MARFFAEISKRDKTPVSRCANDKDDVCVSLDGNQSGVTVRARMLKPYDSKGGVSEERDRFDITLDGGTSGDPNQNMGLSYWRGKDGEINASFDTALLDRVDWAVAFEHVPGLADKLRTLLFVNMHTLTPPGE